MSEQCALDVAWDDTALPGLPTLIGPFDSTAEAQEWATLNVPNGTARVRPLSAPYARSGTHRG